MTESNNFPLVSIIMNCFNSGKYLREAIDSIYAQTYKNWEIVFWDNVSTDNSSDIAQSYKDGRLRYFKGDQYVTLGHARNLAITRSQGEFIAFLDCDDIWLPNKLEKQVPLFLVDNDVGLVYSDTYFFNESGLHRRLYAHKSPYRGYCFSKLLNNYLISLETAVLRRSALDSMDQWFDANFNMIEEHDLFARIGLDWKIDFSSEVLAKWRVHGESLSWKSPDAFIHETRSMLKKLQGMPKIREKHAHDLAQAWRGVSISEVKMLWKMGDGKGARRILLKYPNLGTIGILIWFASFFRYALIESVYRILNVTVKPNSDI